ncbi:cupin domain-containing protein [Caviibacterium pharyngocola]|uniref:AraC family transcriptional regulator n=1 Tax=Caviibacterium pharyngocola TaxID=28159 RepID=A0A2M8RY69_9PAST|nr:AraC family transcriptional regulator [Caviibacterium pharyngocola]PJG83831.1 AraC family transcriptional regulator [Caviibacterium pharyngocola]
MDILDRLLQFAQIEGEIHTHCLFQGNWQCEHPQKAGKLSGIFHIVLRGECLLFSDNEKIRLTAGDIFFLPTGSSHILRSSQDETDLYAPTLRQSNGLLNLATVGVQDEADFEMFCGAFYYDNQSMLASILPRRLHLSVADTPLARLISLFRAEAANVQAGAKSVINALSVVLCTYMLRDYLAQHHEHQGLLAGLSDKRLSAVISAVLNAPAEPWNMASLAQTANMSRANFIRVFQQKIGMSPGNFLTASRLQFASMLLRKTQKTVLSVALESGYRSEAHFNKAFKAAYGIPPGHYRKQEENNG